MGPDCRVLQIVGFSNSGKTTLMEKILERCKEELAWNVVTIKHHGHRGERLYDSREVKDSDRHLKAGAMMTVVEGGGDFILHKQNHVESLAQTIKLLRYLEADFILVEGYKSECYPKVVILKGHGDQRLLDGMENVQVIITWGRPFEADVPVFSIYEEEKYVPFIVKRIRSL
ncbi:molybdopterin-guanine dinucleotide biosynthesis protein B [Halalkalibacter hemicellulosilyticus]|uniref:Molybdopterin-guanine dinucleotide biosynthesis protein MobB n=1 Tax=Halalkalibacter hemicellulosilyticusJCM 9152 TaxID=1236971 RepID=W4QLF9_9BACI|nr:molybdopterin-guanine dinucleotide biosynthesis protein B [Halalkalibacter hemicellulosilyticus]GAE32468.1 molybdopterin-guanine dinucleotide biosynthesis protein MobB [Halalkalibacter hemicellulosilyticusJCM 9152]